MNKRIRILQIVFIGWSFLLILRLGYWQILKSSQLRKEAFAQYSSQTTIPAGRGSIYYSDGFPMVTNQESYLLYANPKLLPSGPSVLESLYRLLPASDSARETLSSAAGMHLSWLVLSHYIPYTTRQSIEALHLPGLGFETETSRLYLEGSSSAYLTGFVGKDVSGNTQGYFGLEGFYDRQLSGKNGKLWEDRDAFNRPIVISDSNRLPPQPGNDLYTSIDRTLMFIASQKLADGMTKHQSLSGEVAIMDSGTGRVLAMVSLPGYSQSDYFKFDPAVYKNPLVSESYEPGSTFKTIVMASALDAGVVKPDTVCTVCGGPVEYSGMKINSWDGKYYPNSTMTDIILHSDNVGMTFVSRKLGKDRLADYLKKFGIGQMTGVDLQEESVSPVRPPAEWQDIDWATISFGQGIAVTPLQLLTAVNALANHGNYVTPQIVTKIVSPQNIKIINPAAPVRVVSPRAAAQITEMMVNGVNKGPVHVYKPEGYLVAGKTGTAQVPISGHYDANNVISSFIGFAPADDPKFTMLVVLRQSNSTDWGSTTAAPIWFDIAKEIFRYYQIPPNTP